jgi:hypothetical protein
MRLEEDEHSMPISHRLDRRANLSWVMGVVVEHAHTAGLAAQLEAPAGAGEFGDVRSGLVRRNPGQLERGQRSRCVAAVVLSGQGQLEVDRRQVVAANDIRDLRPAT